MEKRSVAVAVEGKAVKHVNKRAIAILLAIVVTIQITGCGLVSVNHLETTKPDKSVEQGDVLVLRGKGKAILAEVGGESKKGRIWISINKFI